MCSTFIKNKNNNSHLLKSLSVCHEKNYNNNATIAFSHRIKIALICKIQQDEDIWKEAKDKCISRWWRRFLSLFFFLFDICRCTDCVHCVLL